MFLWAALDLSSDSLCYDLKDKTIEASGHVVVRYKDKTLRCAKMVFDQKTQQIEVVGESLLTDEKDNEFKGHNIKTDLEFNKVLVEHFSVLVHDMFFFKCQRGKKEPGSLTFYESYFTPCRIENPLWALDAEKIVYDQKKDRVFHYKAMLRIKNVKILRLPYFSHVGPKTKRGRGFLPFLMNPLSGDLGMVLGVPYYIPFTEYNDFTGSAYFVSSYGLGAQGEYRHNFYKGNFEANASFFKRIRNEDNFEDPFYYHANVKFKKKSQRNLFNANLKHAKSPDYLKKFWFLYDKGIIYHEPLISKAQYSFLFNEGHVSAAAFWIQNRKEENPEFLAPFVEMDLNKYGFHFKTKNFYLSSDQKSFNNKGYSLNRLEWNKMGAIGGLLIYGRVGTDLIVQDGETEFLPLGTLGVSLPLLNPSLKAIIEPLIIAHFAKPFEKDYKDIFIGANYDFDDENLLQHKGDTISNQVYEITAGLKGKVLQEGIHFFVGGVKKEKVPDIKKILNLRIDAHQYISLYSHLTFLNEVQFFEGGAQLKTSKVQIYGGLAYTDKTNTDTEQKPYTQYTFDMQCHLSPKWSFCLGYMGNAKWTSDEHKFLTYTTLGYENECVFLEFGFSLDRMVRSFRKDADIGAWLSDYRVLLQIAPKFAKTKAERRLYFPKSILVD